MVEQHLRTNGTNSSDPIVPLNEQIGHHYQTQNGRATPLDNEYPTLPAAIFPNRPQTVQQMRPRSRVFTNPYAEIKPQPTAQEKKKPQRRVAYRRAKSKKKEGGKIQK